MMYPLALALACIMLVVGSLCFIVLYPIVKGDHLDGGAMVLFYGLFGIGVVLIFAGFVLGSTALIRMSE